MPSKGLPHAEERPKGASRSGHGRFRPVLSLLIGPYALFLFVLLVVPFANVALYSVHLYSPTRILTPELTLENYGSLDTTRSQEQLPGR